MPAQETSHRMQWAVLWTPGGTDRHGQPLLDPPVEVRVRWNDTQRRVLDAQGNTIALDAEVIAGQQIPVGSLMWQGRLTDWYASGSAGSDTGLCQVKTSDKTPDLKNRANAFEMGLMRWKDRPASLA